MASRLFAVAAGVSLVVCVAIVGLWVRGYWVGDSWVWNRPDGRIGIASARGRLEWTRVSYPPGAAVTFSGAAGYYAGPASGAGLSSRITSPPPGPRALPRRCRR